MKRIPLLFLLLVAAIAWACDSSDGDSDPTDVQETFDYVWPPPNDEVEHGDLDVPITEDVDSFLPECVEADDCIGKFDRPLTKCEQPACNDNLCEIVGKSDNADCDDNDPCTQGDKCQDGNCVPGFDTCDCRTNDECADREDGNPCNGTLYCDTQSVPYLCKADPATIVACDDNRDTTCMQNQCDSDDGICKMSPANEGVSCDDFDPCTSATRCDAAGQCVGHDACQCHGNPGDCAAFDDSDLCNGTHMCDMSSIPFTCVIDPNTVVYCSSANNTSCARNRCQPETGNCVMVPMPNDTPCEDGSQCTNGDSCQEGICVPGGATDCDDVNPCTNDGCDPSSGSCTHVPNASACEDEHECFVGDVCSAGVCTRGTPLNCGDGDVCTVDECVADGDPTNDPCVHTFSEVLCPPPE